MDWIICALVAVVGGTFGALVTVGGGILLGRLVDWMAG